MTLEQAIEKLLENKINPVRGVLVKLDKSELVDLRVSWSPITRSAGYEKLRDLLGDGVDIFWISREGAFLITVKK